MHEFVPTLKKVPLFSNLSEREINEAAPCFKLVRVKKDETILRINEEGKYLYILKYGQVKIIVPDENDGTDNVLATLGPGNYFGEMSLLTGEPVSATVKTSLDSEFLILDKDEFTKLLQKYSRLAYTLSMILSKRLRERNIFRQMHAIPEKVGIFSGYNAICSLKTAFLVGLSLYLEGLDRILIIDFQDTPTETFSQMGFIEAREKLDTFIASHDIGQDLKNIQGILYEYTHLDEKNGAHQLGLHRKRHSARTRFPKQYAHDKYEYLPGLYVLKIEEDGVSDPILASHISPLLGLVAQIYDVVLLDLGSQIIPSTAKALSQTDKCIFICEKQTESLSILSENIKKLCQIEQSKITLPSVLLFDSPENQPMSFMQIREILHCQSVSINNLGVQKDYFDNLSIKDRDTQNCVQIGRSIGRIARRISGTTVGIALGGGGARGYAHIGALKVLEENGFPIDIIAGSSMGALVGAIYCMTGSASETESILRHELADHSNIFDFHVPVNSFLRGKRIKKIADTVFKDITFSDMLIPLYIVCVDLITGQEIVLNDGLVSVAVQASSALPGIFRPIRWGDKYLVDGSVINKVPANILHKQKVNISISVNVTPDRETFMETKESTRTGIGKLVRKFAFFRDWLDEPSILQIINRSLNITNTQMSKAGAQFTSFEIKPYIEQFDFLNFKKIDPIIHAGEIATRECMEELKKIVYS